MIAISQDDLIAWLVEQSKWSRKITGVNTTSRTIATIIEHIEGMEKINVTMPDDVKIYARCVENCIDGDCTVCLYSGVPDCKNQLKRDLYSINLEE